MEPQTSCGTSVWDAGGKVVDAGGTVVDTVVSVVTVPFKAIGGLFD